MAKDRIGEKRDEMVQEQELQNLALLVQKEFYIFRLEQVLFPLFFPAAFLVCVGDGSIGSRGSVTIPHGSFLLRPVERDGVTLPFSRKEEEKKKPSSDFFFTSGRNRTRREKGSISFDQLWPKT